MPQRLDWLERVDKAVPTGGRRHELRDTCGSLRTDSARIEAIYRDRLNRFGPLIGDREPIVLHKEIPGMGRAKRYIITIADDESAPQDKLCRKLIAADATCDVLRNPVRQ
jgi:hypothetical protein